VFYWCLTIYILTFLNPQVYLLDIGNTPIMALQELPSALRQLTIRQIRQTTRCVTPIARRYASGEAAAAAPVELPTSEDLKDLEPQSSFTTKFSREASKDYDPIKRSKARKSQLPASRYVYLSMEPCERY
jgi:large subunit ribosomal protein L5